MNFLPQSTQSIVQSKLLTVKAFHLNTGWQCSRICHICTGHEWHDPRDSAAWYVDGPGASPYKPGDVSPFLTLPGCNLPHHAQLDIMHSFHMGYGIDMAASTVVLLCLLNVFGNARALNDKLTTAYQQFSAWCAQNHKPTSITRFSKQDFDMALKLPLLLGRDSFSFHVFGKLFVASTNIYIVPFLGPLDVNPRNNSFPVSLNGKAYDTAVVLAWLEAAMAGPHAASVTGFY